MRRQNVTAQLDHVQLVLLAHRANFPHANLQLGVFKDSLAGRQSFVFRRAPVKLRLERRLEGFVASSAEENGNLVNLRLMLLQ